MRVELRGTFEDILHRELVFGRNLALLYVVILVVDPGNTNGFRVATLIDYLAGQVKGNLSTIAHIVNIYSPLGTRAEYFQDNLYKIDKLGVLLEIFDYARVIVDVAQSSRKGLNSILDTKFLRSCSRRSHSFW